MTIRLNIWARSLPLPDLGADLPPESVNNRAQIRCGRQTVPLPFSKLSRKTLELALREALRLGRSYIGCEHIVLALVQVGRDGVAGQILADQGVTYERLERAIRDALPGTA